MTVWQNQQKTTHTEAACAHARRRHDRRRRQSVPCELSNEWRLGRLRRREANVMAAMRVLDRARTPPAMVNQLPSFGSGGRSSEHPLLQVIPGPGDGHIRE